MGCWVEPGGGVGTARAAACAACARSRSCWRSRMRSSSSETAGAGIGVVGVEICVGDCGVKGDGCCTWYSVGAEKERGGCGCVTVGAGEETACGGG